MICYIAFLTIILSALLDNIVGIMLMGQVVLRICMICEIAPQPVMMMTIFFSNIGGFTTPIGDATNLLIINHQYFTDNVGLFFAY